MRRLLCAVIGFGLGCFLCVYLSSGSWILASSICAVLGVVLWIARQRWRCLRKPFLILIGLLLGICWFWIYSAFYLSFADGLNGRTEEASIRVSDYSRASSFGSSFDGVLTIRSRPFQVRVYPNERKDLSPGMEVQGRFCFRVTTAKEMKRSSFYQSKGIFLIAYQEGDMTFVEADSRWWDFPAVMRHGLQSVLSKCFPKDTEGFARALLLGDTSNLDYKTDTDLKISGIRHVAAVSGLHVSILFVLIGMLTRKRQILTVLIGIPALAIFASLAGFTPSVNRACIMSGLMLLGQLLDKDYDAPTALSFAVLVMLLINPMAVNSVSLQLSVGSVAGILLFSEPMGRWLRQRLGYKERGGHMRGLIGWISGSVSICLGSCVLTIPLSAWYFGTVSLISPLTNLLTLWVISFIFYGILAVCTVFFLAEGAAVILAKIVSYPIRYVLFTAGVLADFPLASVYTRSLYITLWLIFAYCLLTVFLLSREKKPRVLACCISLGLCIALLASWIEPRLDNTRFTVLDVGQGQCLLLQSGGRSYMVDCGGDQSELSADAAAETLLSMGITKLDAFILTHADQDHSGGLEYLLSRIDTQLVILPKECKQLWDIPKTQVVYATENLDISDGNSTLHIFAPDFQGNSNEMSLCILFDTEKCDILITGDRNQKSERLLLARENIPQVDILIAGHHGASDSVSEELLKTTKPEIVCISAGANNRYGHPAKKTLQRLGQFGCQIYRTDLQGTITIRR